MYVNVTAPLLGGGGGVTQGKVTAGVTFKFKKRLHTMKMSQTVSVNCILRDQ